MISNTTCLKTQCVSMISISNVEKHNVFFWFHTPNIEQLNAFQWFRTNMLKNTMLLNDSKPKSFKNIVFFNDFKVKCAKNTMFFNDFNLKQIKTQCFSMISNLFFSPLSDQSFSFFLRSGRAVLMSLVFNDFELEC
jgi:hypothetical protein